jgi:hypothetical protein
MHEINIRWRSEIVLSVDNLNQLLVTVNLAQSAAEIPKYKSHSP